MLLPIKMQLIFLVLTAAVSLWLVMLVYRHNGFSLLANVFSITNFSILVWLCAVHASLFPIFSSSALFFARASMAAAIPMNLSIFLLIFILTRDRLPRPIILAALGIFASVVFVLSWSPYIFSGVTIGPEIFAIPGPALPIFGIFVGGLILVDLYSLIRGIRTSDSALRKRLVLVLCAVVGMNVGIMTTVFLPIVFFQNATLVQFAPIYVLVFLLFTAIAILKYQLFNVKLLLTEGLVILFGSMIFVQLFILDLRNSFGDILRFLSASNFEVLVGVFSLLLCVYLGVTVFIKNPKSATNQLFFLLSLSLAAYIIINYLSLHPPGGEKTQLFWIRLVMAICSLIGPTVLLLAATFPNDRFTLNNKYLVLLFALFAVSFSASLAPYVFTELTFSGGLPLPVPGPGMPIFLIDFVGLFIISFVMLVVKYRKAQGTDKRSFLHFTIGVVLTFSIMAATTVISVVFLKNSAPVFLGPLSSVVLVAFVSYAIVKHHILNIKVFAVEFFIVLVVAVLVAEGLASRAVGESVFKILFAVVLGLAGPFLVKSIRRDITQERELERLRTIEALYQEKEELDRQKTEFLTIAAHQLRTPVSIINNYVAMLQDGDYGKISGEAKEVLVNIEQSNQWLVRLANEFMNIANIEHGQMKYHFIEQDLRPIVESVVEELKPKARHARVKMVWEKPPESFMIAVDEEKIRAVIFNFVDNAIKYGARPGGREFAAVTIRAQNKDGGVSFTVVDQGLGFNPEDTARFFQKFSRGNNASAVHVNLSTGLGLYIARKFVEGHGGKVWAKSDGLGKGSEFGFWVPFKPPAVL